MVILEVNNVSLIMSQFDLPWPKEEASDLSGKNKTRCFKRFAALHCGLQQGNGEADIYAWGEVTAIFLGITGRLEVSSGPEETEENKIKVSIEDSFEFSVLLTNETFSIWNKNSSSANNRPWLQINSFPLITSGYSSLVSSGLMDGMKIFFPH